MNNAISFYPEVNEKNEIINWTDKMKNFYLRRNRKRWERAIKKIPNFDTMKPEQVNAWHDEQARMGEEIRKQEEHSNKKKKNK